MENTTPSRSSPVEGKGIPWPRPNAGTMLVLGAAGLTSLALAHLESGTPGVETLFLAIEATLAATALIVLAPSATGTRWLVAALPAALWLLPAGASRAATVSALIVIGLAGSILWRWSTKQPWGLAHLVVLAVVLELLFDPELVLNTIQDPSALLSWSPAIASAVAIRFARDQPSTLVGPLSLALAAALGGGFDTTVAAVVVALAGGSRLAERPNGPLGWGPAIVMLAAAAAIDWRIAAIGALGALLLGLPAWPSVAVISVVVASAVLVGATPTSTVRSLWPLLLVLPGLALPSRTDLRRSAAVVGLAYGVAVVIDPAAGLVAGAVVALLLLDEVGLDGWPAIWSVAVLAGLSLVASFPWVRPAPADAFALAVGIPAGWATAAAVAALLAVLVRIEGRRRRLVLASLLVGGLVARFGLDGPTDRQIVVTHQVELSERHPRLGIPLDDGRLAALTVVSTAANTAGLPPGTTIAFVRVERQDGSIERWPIRLHDESGEWAARRPELGADPGPAAWQCRITPGEPVFTQLYRATWRPREPLEVVDVEIRRARDLPSDTTTTITRVEVEG